jgi:hypothetical protein
MKYICFCYYNPKVASALSPSEMEALSAACQPHYETWEQTGKLVAMAGLPDPQAWRTIRPTDTVDDPNGKPVVENGPYLPGGDRMGAFFFVEANDIDEAVAIAAKHPGAHTGRFLGGGIEVCACDAFQSDLSFQHSPSVG